MFAGRGMFSALFASIVGSLLYNLFEKKLTSLKMIFADGTDAIFNSAMSIITPVCLVIFIFAIFNYLITIFFNVSCIQELFILAINTIFKNLNRSYKYFIIF